MKLRILTASDIDQALTMPQAIDLMASAFTQLSAGRATVPLRSKMEFPQGVTLLMPAYLHDTQAFATKIVSVFDGNPDRGLPRISALVMLFDPSTGQPLALMDGERITAIRTGAVGGLAARYLAREDAHCVALFGAGIQGRSQLEAVMAVRKVERVLIYDLHPAAGENLARELTQQGFAPAVTVVSRPEDAVLPADIILTATNATAPLFDGRKVRPGTHITAVGSFTPEMQEIDPDLVRRARVVVDSRLAAGVEAGDILKAQADIAAEIGEIVAGTKPGRQTPEEITFFKSVGVGVQDAAAAYAVYHAAEQYQLGGIVTL